MDWLVCELFARQVAAGKFTRRPVQTTRKLGCLAVARVQEIVRFPTFKVQMKKFYFFIAEYSVVVWLDGLVVPVERDGAKETHSTRDAVTKTGALSHTVDSCPSTKLIGSLSRLLQSCGWLTSEDEPPCLKKNDCHFGCYITPFTYLLTFYSSTKTALYVYAICVFC